MSTPLRIALVGAALALAACGSEPTYLLTTIERGSVPADTPILGLETTIDLDGRHDMTPMLTPAAGADFALPTTLTLELADGTGTARIGVNAYGADNALLSAGSTELVLTPGEVIPVTVALGSHVTPPPDGGTDDSVVSIDPGIVSFGTHTVDDVVTETFTVGNSGTGPSRPLSVGLDGTGAPTFEVVEDHCSGLELQPTTVCTFDLRFHPASVGTWSTNAEVAPYELVATGGASGSGVLFSLSDSSLSFGTLALSNSDTRTVTVTNTSAAMSTQAMAFVVDDPASPDEFTIDAATTTCVAGQVLSAGASCTVTIRFTPAITGARSATLRVTDRATMTVALSGTGTEI